MSTIKTDTLQNVAGSLSVPVATVVNGSAKAWVNFNGDGTITIRAAFNVSSITDNGPGDYTVNFTSAMPDANYAAIGTGFHNGGYTLVLLPSAYASTNCRFILRINGQNVIEQSDRNVVNVAIFR